MNIIPQNIKNEAEKIVKNVTEQAMKKYRDEVANIIVDVDPAFKFLILNAKMNSLLKEIYTNSIIQLDEFFYQSEYRKKHYYSSSFRDRTYVTTVGEINFERRYYVDKKDKKSGFYFVDEILQYEKFKTYDVSVRAILIQQSTITNPNEASKNSEFHLSDWQSYIENNKIPKVPRQTIYEWLKQWNLPKVEYPYYENVKKLYVMVDEKWIHEQIRKITLTEEEKKKHHHIMSKCFVTFSGSTKKNGRSELLNRHVFLTSNDDPWKLFIEDIYNIYNFEEIEEIYLLSDSGSWILAGKSELKLFKQNNVITNTCGFHVKQYINRLVANKEKRDELVKIIYEEEDKKKFKKVTDEIIAKSKNKEKKEKYQNYVLKHWRSILNMKERECKSSMESHISHCVASKFGSRPKGFSKKRLEKYLKLQEYQENGINILDLYLRSYKNKKEDNYVYHQDNISISINEHNYSSILPCKSSANPISNVLNNIAYNFSF